MVVCLGGGKGDIEEAVYVDCIKDVMWQCNVQQAIGACMVVCRTLALTMTLPLFIKLCITVRAANVGLRRAATFLRGPPKRDAGAGPTAAASATPLFYP